jgi:hypothetical protein
MLLTDASIHFSLVSQINQYLDIRNENPTPIVRENRINQLKRANKFETPGPNTDIHGNITGDKKPIVSMVGNDPKLSSTYKEPKLPKSFEEMQRHGLKITSYTTTEE